MLRLTLEPLAAGRRRVRLPARPAPARARRPAFCSRRHRQRAPSPLRARIRSRQGRGCVLPRAGRRLASGPPDARAGQLTLRLRRFAALALSLGLAGCSTFTSMRGSPGFAVSSARFCDQSEVQDARQQDRLLRFAAVVRGELEASGADVALISRTGIDLKNLGIRFSHTGIGLKQGGDVPWSVRQLYYACDEGRPRLFDQGVAGFLFNTDEPAIGHVSIVLPPHRSGDPARADGAGQAACVAPAGGPLQCQRLSFQHALPELQPVGDGAARHRLGRPSGRRRPARARPGVAGCQPLRPGRRWTSTLTW